MKKNKIYPFLSVCFILSSGFSQAPGPLFDPSKAPTKEDWVHFRNASPTTQEAIWSSLHRKDLASWHWGWRLAFVQSCASAQYPTCDKILLEGLADKAAVVRASAATSVSSIADKGDPNVLAQLETAYQNKKNWRHGEPLFVQFRILDAILKVGGEAAIDLAKKLSREHPKTIKYLKKQGLEGKAL